MGEDAAEPPTIEKLIEVQIGDEKHKTMFVGAYLPAHERDGLITFLRANTDVFAWSFAEMPGIDPNVAFHRLNIDEKFHPVRQKIRNMTQSKKDGVTAEVEKLLEAGFIRLVQYPRWMSNVVPVPKKNGKIRVCIDFTDLNKACPSDPYPLPRIIDLVDATSGYGRLSFMDVIEINFDSSLADAVQILSRHKLLSAIVRNVEAPEDASWIDRYNGIVELQGIVVWLLHQSEVTALNGSSAPEAVASSDFYKTTKVQDISGSFRWAPFLAPQKSDTFLTMLLLLSKYKMKSLPVVDLGEGNIDNIITQSSVVHMLAECVGLHWFESWGTKKLKDLGLPIMKPHKLIKVYEDEPVLKAFKLMREKRIGGLPVVECNGQKALGNISVRDVQFLLAAPEIYKDYRSITAKSFLTAVRNHLKEQQEASPMLRGMITCRKDDTIKDVILKLDSEKIHRIYVVDADENLEGVISLRDIISKLVHEPRNYFGDFFDGVIPLPRNSSSV
ncbi:SNF1-related protein kinase regulatory subunit gamma-1-like [Papaver somniferum]|uniref:SNF1-related protein kinase regulatory subunit gamma-1-like n=1 Tax=Papaver somniferum TaxID=3469 RepID=UPI000E6FD770|nr:SNF1-related protein kinase regulatory subunit gamma-1-like [Papaver somniferum]